MRKETFSKALLITAIFLIPASILFAQEDTDPPELLSLDFNPKTIDVSNGPQDVTVTMTITDNISGFDNGWVAFYSPSGQQHQAFYLGSGVRISGDEFYGIYEGTVTFPQHCESGTWHINTVKLEDKVGNHRFLYEIDLSTMGSPTELEVLGGEDLLPPELLSLDFDPKTIDVSNGPQDVTVTMTITDNISGFDNGWVAFYSPSGQQHQAFYLGSGVRISGDEFYGIYEGTVTFPQYCESGAWHINTVKLEDKIGNHRFLYEIDLGTMGSPTELYVGENSPPVAVCNDITTAADGNCQASITAEDIDGGSYDIDEGDNITLSIDNIGPFSLGEHYVGLTVTDDQGESDYCQAKVTVVDNTPPVIQCNTPAYITPPDAPISFTATATDSCGPITANVETFDCYSFNPTGKKVDRSCAAFIVGETFTVTDTGGVNDTITWTVTVTDGSGNTATEECSIVVVNPGRDKD